MFNHKAIEKKWQKIWDKEKIYEAKDFSKKPKYYSLVEFPYPSGDGLHAGHVRSYTAMDIISRKRRMDGFNVLFPIGWDAFGLPTENFAIKKKIHPKIVTKKNTDTFRRQLKSLGLSFDWTREINTTDPKYYKWTQWIFLQLYKHGLAYKKKMPINWCISCKTGLANEEVVNSSCERCGGAVEKREKEQWILAITKYADKLLKDLNKVDYLEKIKIQQANWIGKSEGINITYDIDGSDKKITVYTTRPDTNFGATFIVVAPESDFSKENKNLFSNKKEIEKYIAESRNKSDVERIAEGRKKTGVFTGLYAINHLTERKMPIYISDFVLATVGTGAVVGVPGHDARDFEFAKEKKLDIIRVVVGSDGDKSPIRNIEQVQEKSGTMINSGFLDGLEINEATEKIKDYLEKKKWGKRTVNFHLRDWIFSRQHYWGEPIPIVFCDKCGEVPVPEKDLPVELPNVKNYQPTDTGESPLAAMKNWVNVKCPKCGEPAKRETDTMPNWAGSSWYFLRYTDPKNNKAFADAKKLKYWMPIDWYNGGMEHTTLHLLYSRFWNKFLYDIGEVPVSEPYKKRTSQGMVLGATGEKMSKSKGNVVNPDEVVKIFGADTLRIYEMFMGPFDQAIPWDEKGLVGCARFLGKVWSIGTEKISKKADSNRIEKLINQTVKKVGGDIETMNFNTAVSSLMIFINECQKEEKISEKNWEKFLLILSPFAPHISEELYQNLKPKSYKLKPFKSIHFEPWPKYDPKLIKEENFDLIVQINGKMRDKISVPAGISQKEAEGFAFANEKIKIWIKEGEVKKVIYVPNKLINIVI